MSTHTLTVAQRPTGARVADGVEQPAHEPHTHGHEQGLVLHWGSAHIFIPDEPNEEGKYVLKSSVPLDYDPEGNNIVVLSFDVEADDSH